MTVALADLNEMTLPAFVAAVGDTFELAPWVAEAAHGKRPFATVADLHLTMMAAVRGASHAAQVAFLGQHPDLAGKAARAGEVTGESRDEQASVGLDTLSESEFARFHRLNDAYRTKFGFPFIVCVRRHTRDSILQQFERRLANDEGQEFAAAIQEVFLITRLRIAAKSRAKAYRRSTGASAPTCSIPISAGRRPASQSSFTSWPASDITG